MADLRQAPPSLADIWDRPLSNDTVAGTPGSGLPRIATKTLTFTGASTLGLHGTSSTIFTVTGLILVEFICARATTNLTGATATITFGTTSKTTLFLGTTTVTNLVTTTEIWANATPVQGGVVLPATMINTVIDENVIIPSTHVSADVTAGVLEIDMIWRPLTRTATVV